MTSFCEFTDPPIIRITRKTMVSKVIKTKVMQKNSLSSFLDTSLQDKLELSGSWESPSTFSVWLLSLKSRSLFSLKAWTLQEVLFLLAIVQLLHLVNQADGKMLLLASFSAHRGSGLEVSWKLTDITKTDKIQETTLKHKVMARYTAGNEINRF